MLELTLRVTDSPRWDGAAGRWQNPGEEVTLRAEHEHDLWLLYVDYAEHCREVVRGTVPRAPWDRSAPSGMDRRAPRGQMRPSPSPSPPKVEKPAAPAQNSAIGYVCEECGTSFRSRKGIELHRRNAHPETVTEE